MMERMYPGFLTVVPVHFVVGVPRGLPRADDARASQVSCDEESGRRLGILPASTSPFLFRAEAPGGVSGQTTQPPAKVQAAVLHAGSTLDVTIKLNEAVAVPVGRW